MSLQLLQKPQRRRLGRSWRGDRKEKQSIGWQFSELEILGNYYSRSIVLIWKIQLLICDICDPGLNSLYSVTYTAYRRKPLLLCLMVIKISQLLIYLQNIGLNITFVQCKGCVCLCSLCKACSGERREEVNMVTALMPNPFFL